MSTKKLAQVGVQAAADTQVHPQAHPQAHPQEHPQGHPQDHITGYWDRRSTAYDGNAGHGIRNDDERRAWLEALANLLPAAPADVLDAGTGTGFLAVLAAQLGHRVTGIDVSEGMLALARAKAAELAADVRRPTFVLGDAMAPPLPPCSVDVVVSRHLLWTLTEPERAFESWRRLLRPGGRLVAIDGLWQLGRRAEPRPQLPEPWRVLWDRHYTDAVQDSLPFFDATTLDPIVAAVERAGFSDVRVLGLDEVERVEGELAPDRPPRSARYVVTATHGG